MPALPREHNVADESVGVGCILRRVGAVVDNRHRLKPHLFFADALNFLVAFSRGGNVIAIATEGDKEIQGIAEHVVFVPDTIEPLQPLLTSIPLQLIAYHAAVKRGCNVDKPRNLAKSVTVE